MLLFLEGTLETMKNSLIMLLTGVLIASSASSNSAVADGWDDLALTPPMGWNSWNTFRLEINEDLVRGIADMFVEKGFKDAGYEYIVIDDGWQIAHVSNASHLLIRD